MALNGSKRPNSAQLPNYECLSAKILLEWALPRMAQNSQKLQKRPKVVPDSHRLWVLLGKNDPTCFLARPIWKKTLPCLFYYYAKWTYLTQKQTNKQNIKIYRRKYINITSRIHTFVLEEMQIRKPCQIKIAF